MKIDHLYCLVWFSLLAHKSYPQLLGISLLWERKPLLLAVHWQFHLFSMIGQCECNGCRTSSQLISQYTEFKYIIHIITNDMSLWLTTFENSDMILCELHGHHRDVDSRYWFGRCGSCWLRGGLDFVDIPAGTYGCGCGLFYFLNIM